MILRIDGELPFGTQEVYLKLRYSKIVGTNEEIVQFVAVDRNGKDYPNNIILEVYKSGVISLEVNVNPNLGFQLDEAGRVKLV